MASSTVRALDPGHKHRKDYLASIGEASGQGYAHPRGCEQGMKRRDPEALRTHEWKEGHTTELKRASSSYNPRHGGGTERKLALSNILSPVNSQTEVRRR